LEDFNQAINRSSAPGATKEENLAVNNKISDWKHLYLILWTIDHSTTWDLATLLNTV
jgi:hypothetical protein